VYMPVSDTDYRFILECPNCDFDKRTDDLYAAIDIADGHERHTSHEIDWVRYEWESEYLLSHTVYEASCSACGTEAEFTDKEAFEEYRREHERYTDHKLASEDVETRQNEALDVPEDEMLDSGPNAKNVISILESRFEEGAPYEAVIQVLVDCGMTPTRATGNIERLKQRGEVYEPSKGHLRTT